MYLLRRRQRIASKPHALRAAHDLCRWSAWAVVVILSISGRGWAQVESRAAEIEAARQAKAQTVTPDEPSKAERAVRTFRDKKIMERFSAGVAGFRLKLGGLVSGGGFAIGPEYYRQDLADGNLTFRSAAQSSFRGYQRYDLQVTAPGFARDTLFCDFFALHHNYPGINYYGPGPDSQKTPRTNYRLEDTAIDLTVGLQPFRRRLTLGASGGYLWVNVGPGGDARFASTDRVFTPAQVPGIDHQSDFFRYGFFAQIDYRDNPRGPRSGGHYAVKYNHYIDQNLGGFSFNRLDLEAKQFIPFFNKRRVVALRAKAALTDPTGANVVPFYLMPTVGGSDDLRGFRRFRFSDSNMLVVNGEYRWEVFSGLDMALFADGGKVFPRRSQLNFHDLETSAGFGFRFNARGNVFFRIDVGFSREGAQVWFKFDNVFLEERIRSSVFQ
jgi:outer membrane protein assembly factor BamA